MPSTAEKLWAAAQALPEALQVEVLDFAEFVRYKHVRQQAHPPAAVAESGAPGLSLLDLQGGLEASPTFAGDPASLQRQLRDEWP